MCANIPMASSLAFNPIHTLSTCSNNAIQLTRRVAAAAAFCLIHAARIGIFVGAEAYIFYAASCVPMLFVPVALCVSLYVSIQFVLPIQERILNPNFSALARSTYRCIYG